MKKGKLGFTLVEVSLFLAITAVLFVGVTIGVQGSINNQRYTDSVQSYMEFLRGVYASVLNVQNETTGGNTGEAIYGKLVTFGETTDLAGGAVSDPNTIFVYTVVGDIKKNLESKGAIELLKTDLKADVARVTKDATGVSSFKLVGFPESYLPKWGTQIEVDCIESGNCPNTRLNGMLLVVRHPISGVVYTYFKEVSGTDNRNQINDRLKTVGLTSKVLDLGAFDNSTIGAQVDFCVRPSAEGGNMQRSDVRIVANARNASAIELVPREGDDNKCDE